VAFVRKKKFKIEDTLDVERNKPKADAKSVGERYASRFKNHESMDVPFWLRTGNLMLDCAISGGLGIPCGHHIMFRGPEGSGKSKRVLQIGSIAQQMGGLVIGQDVERRWKKSLCDLINFDNNEQNGQFILHHPVTLEEALANLSALYTDILAFPASPHEPPIVTITDSIAALPTSRVILKRIKKGGKIMETTEPMSAPAVLSEWLRQPEVRGIKYRNVFNLWTNQLRDVVDFGVKSYGPKQVHDPGGRALRHNISIRVDVSSASIREELTSEQQKYMHPDFPVGAKINYKVTKNTVGPPNRNAWECWFFHQGEDEVLALFNWLYNYDFIIHKGQGNYTLWGATYTKQEWMQFYYNDPSFREEFRKFFIQSYNCMSLYQNNPVFGDDSDEAE
jgi:RecA/RadA recombinase